MCSQLNVSELSATLPAHFTSRWRAAGTQLIAGYIGSKVGLYVVEKTQETNIRSHITQLVV